MSFLSFALNLIQKRIVIEIRDYENFKRKSKMKRKITYGSKKSTYWEEKNTSKKKIAREEEDLQTASMGEKMTCREKENTFQQKKKMT